MPPLRPAGPPCENHCPVAEERSGFLIRYNSARQLDSDYTKSFAHGGMIVPWKGATPPTNTEISLRIQASDGTTFDISARVGQPIPSQGFVVSFESAVTCRARAALDIYMRGDLFRRKLEGEKAASASSVIVEPFGAMAALDQNANDAGDATDPSPEGTDLLAEDTLDDRPDAPTDASTLSPGEDAGEANDVGSSGEELEECVPEGLRMPLPGEEYVVYAVKFETVTVFAEMRDAMRSTATLTLDFKEEAAKRGAAAQLRLILPGHNIFQMFGLVESVQSGKVVLRFDEKNEKFRLACAYVDTPAARNRLKNEALMEKNPPHVVRQTEIVPEVDPEKMPIRRRLQRMGMDDKINLALSGGREERMALAMDSNKAVHHYLLRNAKISLDEIAFMARLPTMNPDVLDKIAENPSYTQNLTVVKALVYNPKTPVVTAIRLLDRLPRQEVVNLAKRLNMNLRLVMAAKKKLETKRW